LVLAQPTCVRVEAAGRANGDPLIDLLDATGGVIVSDDDSGGGGAARAEVDLDPGQYCLTVNSYNDAPMTAFVRIGRADQEPLTDGVDADLVAPSAGGGLGPDPDGSCSEGVSLGTMGASGAGLTGTAASADTPYWRFTLDQDGPITITAENETADPVIRLFDADEILLGENDDFDGLNARLDMSQPLPAGAYCLQVDSLSDTSAPIDLTISAYDPEAALVAMFQRGDASPPLDGSYPVTDLGLLENRMRQDVTATDTANWFSFDVEAAGLVLVEAISVGNGGDPWLVIFDDLGRQVALNDDFGGRLDALVTARVTPGRYVVGVRQLGSDSPGFVRMLFERYVPAP